MLREIPVELAWRATVIGVAVVVALTALGALLARRAVKDVNLGDVLRDP